MDDLERDDLERYVAEREQREPGFEQLVIGAEKRQAFRRGSSRISAARPARPRLKSLLS